MYQIGAFSKICQVSVKTLRHYDRIGLLRPAEVDRFTGYRYYDRSQLERMLLIQRLKRYGFSLYEVQALLDCKPETLHNALLQQHDRLLVQQQELGVTIHDLTLYLNTWERNDAMEMQSQTEIKLLQTTPTPVLSLRQTMSVDDWGRWYGTLFERIAKERLTPNGVFGAMYHDEAFDRDASDTELFVGITEADRADRVIGAQKCAMAVHKGVYSTLSETYAALMAWIEERGFALDGAPYDLYTKTARDGLAPQDWETEVYFPVRKA